MSRFSRPQNSPTVNRLIGAFAVARIGYAGAMIAAPRRVGRPWLGDAVDLSGGRVAAKALVARDAVISAGFAIAAWRGSSARPWLAAVVASDIADILATVTDSDDLPDQAVPGAIAAAGSAALIGAALYRAADR
jgi:hypothetical protein